GNTAAVNPAQTGTKAAAHWQATVAPGQSAVFHARLSDRAPESIGDPFSGVQSTFSKRLREADEFYPEVPPENATPEAANVMRQAFAGMLWSKQYYYLDATRWLGDRGVDPLEAVITDRSPRNSAWSHMINADVISMPDKWEYPWYAAWDLAFHTAVLNLVDTDFAKNQLLLMLDHQYLHPSGQIPAYEWNFADVNPPVHAWASC